MRTTCQQKGDTNTKLQKKMFRQVTKSMSWKRGSASEKLLKKLAGRQISEIKHVDKIKNVHDKKGGLLVLCVNCKWNNYFTLDDSFFSFEVLRSGIAAHPLTAIMTIEPATKIGYWVDETRIPHGHLRYSDHGFRWRRNFSVLAGYSNHGDEKPNRRLTWFKISFQNDPGAAAFRPLQRKRVVFFVRALTLSEMNTSRRGKHSKANDKSCWISEFKA